MADIQYKKGALLFSGDITTDGNNSPQGHAIADFELGQEVLIINFNNVEYTCKTVHMNENDYRYGYWTEAVRDFSVYPFGLVHFNDSLHDYNQLQLFTENPGTYSLQIYKAVPDISGMKFKKGELLLNETFETVKQSEESEIKKKKKNVSTLCTEDIVIIDFNGTEYTCLAITYPDGYGIMYGGFDTDNYMPDFTNYPFAFATGGNEGQYGAMLATENPGTYTFKVYVAVEDTDSTPLSPTDFIIAYLMKSPQNSNWNVLSSLLGDGDWSKLKAYVETTPKNMNRQVLKVLLGGENSGSSAVVGTAVVGRDTVG